MHISLVILALFSFFPLYAEPQFSIQQAFQDLRPENDLEQRIISHPEWIIGAKEGTPRPGHPEGQIIFHVLEVLGNVDTWCQEHSSSETTRQTLRIIAMIHDTFKHKVDRTKPRTGENHHAMIARRFAEEIGITDLQILSIIEHHDDAYNAYQIQAHGDAKKAHSAVKALLATLKKKGGELATYNAFYWCDSTTGDKDPKPYQWFQKYVSWRE